MLKYDNVMLEFDRDYTDTMDILLVIQNRAYELQYLCIRIFGVERRTRWVLALKNQKVQTITSAVNFNAFYREQKKSKWGQCLKLIFLKNMITTTIAHYNELQNLISDGYRYSNAQLKVKQNI